MDLFPDSESTKVGMSWELPLLKVSHTGIACLYSDRLVQLLLSIIATGCRNGEKLFIYLILDFLGKKGMRFQAT